jgi:hypothetical protein
LVTAVPDDAGNRPAVQSKHPNKPDSTCHAHFIRLHLPKISEQELRESFFKKNKIPCILKMNFSFVFLPCRPHKKSLRS